MNKINDSEMMRLSNMNEVELQNLLNELNSVDYTRIYPEESIMDIRSNNPMLYDNNFVDMPQDLQMTSVPISSDPKYMQGNHFSETHDWMSTIDIDTKA